MDHLIYIGADDELEYLARRYDDGTTTVSTRPLGGDRWSPEIALTQQPAEVTC